jgi:hypothetical protein
MHNKKLLTAAITTAGVAGMVLPLATPALAAPAPPREAYGSMELGGPLQYETFFALQNGRNHGGIDYTNWTYAEPGSGVWAPVAGSHALVFTYQGSNYAHTLNGGLSLVAVSPDQLRFSGTGEYNAQAGATWKINGTVTDGRFSAKITYNGTLQPGYKVALNGKVARDGSVSGMAKSSTGQALTFTMPAGTFISVLHYVAPVTSVQVKGHDATFRFTIPAKVPGLAGTKITVKIHDGGPGRAHDTYAHGVTGTPLSLYPIIGGPGVTVKGGH